MAKKPRKRHTFIKPVLYSAAIMVREKISLLRGESIEVKREDSLCPYVVVIATNQARLDDIVKQFDAIMPPTTKEDQ